LNFTAVAPVKAIPVIVTLKPTPVAVGEKPVMKGCGIAVKVALLTLVPPPVVTLIAPEAAPLGTVAVIRVPELTVKEALAPLIVTEVAPVKALPVIITLAPTAPMAGEKLVIEGGGTTVKLVALVPVPPAVVTLSVPEVAPLGTVAVIWVPESTVNEALVPLNFTDVAPVKAAPVIVTLKPTPIPVGEKLVIEGAGITVKLVALVAVPPGVVTLSAPEVAPLGTLAMI
jgi:hypothetical protein